MAYREERELVIRLHLAAEFGEEYAGDEDGYSWYRDFDEQVRPELLRAVLRVLTSQSAYRITPINRGLDCHEELELNVECLPK